MATSEKNLFTQVRFVIYNKERGIYLDEGYWSADKPKLIKAAKTFTDLEADDFIRSMPTDRTYEKRQVNPTLTDGRASEDDCANALLPRWTD